MEALRGFVFGVAIAAPVGPIALLLIRTGLTHSFGVWLLAGVMRRPVPSQAAARGMPERGPAFVQLYLLTLANPLTVLLFVGFSGQMTAGGGALAVVGNALFLFLGSLAVQASYAAFGAALQRLIRHRGSVRTLNAAGALAVAVFGAYGLWKGG